jgi:hypothetical protein
MSVPREVLLTHSTGLKKREKILVMQFWPFTIYLLQHWYIKNLKHCRNPFSSIEYLAYDVSTWHWNEGMHRVTEKFLHSGNMFTLQATVLTHIHFCRAADFLSISTIALSLLIATLWCYLSVETIALWSY